MPANDGTSLVVTMRLLAGGYDACRHDQSPKNAADPEWPPHPARLFAALAGACQQCFAKDGPESRALEWLEGLDPPEILACGAASVRHAVHRGVYVPVNPGRAEDTHALLDAVRLTHKKRERNFVSVHPQNPVVRFVWSVGSAEDARAHAAALNRLAAMVACVGRSTSLVALDVRVLDGSDSVLSSSAGVWRPLPFGADTVSDDARIRVPRRRSLADLCMIEKRRSNGIIDMRMAGRYAETVRYRFFGSASPCPRAADDGHTERLEHVWVLRRTDGTRPSAARAQSRVAEALRGAIIRHAQDLLDADSDLRERIGSVPPGLLTGHASDGSPAKTPHLAVVPLHAAAYGTDEPVLGGALLALPPSPSELIVFLRQIVATLPRVVMGGWGTWRLEPVEPFNCANIAGYLRPGAYTDRNGAHLWRTVTPMVLNRNLDREGRRTSRAVKAVTEACVHAGLPEPEAIEIGDGCMAWTQLGGKPVPWGIPVRRYPPWRMADGHMKTMTHVAIRFAEAVTGPVLLGDGRFKGLGLFAPQNWRVGR